MRLAINLVKTHVMYCVESAAASVANWLGRDYQMMASYMWGFNFDEAAYSQHRCIGNAIYAGFNEEEVLNALEKYHGIKATYHSYTDKEQFIKEVYSQLNKGMPVATTVNEYKLGWIDRKWNVPGYLLIVGYEDDKTLDCIDVHNSLKDVKQVPVDCIWPPIQAREQGFECYTYTLAGNQQVKDGYKDFLQNVKGNDKLNTDCFEKMRKLADAIENDFKCSIERGANKFVYYIPIMHNIMDVIRGRSMVSDMLSYLSKQGVDENCHYLERKFFELSVRWNEIWNKLNQTFYGVGADNEEAVKKQVAMWIRNVASQEESLYHQIITSRFGEEGKTYLEEEQAPSGINKDHIVFASFDRYMNNKGFAKDEDNDEGADLSGNSEFFVLDEQEQDKVIDLQQMRFKLTLDEMNCDNILCSGQVLPMDKAHYKRLLLLGCAEWGDSDGTCIVTYEDGTKEQAYLYIPNWYQASIEEGERIVWQGDIVNMDGQHEKRYLYALSYLLNQDKKLASIELPKSKNMHIFAISLENV